MLFIFIEMILFKPNTDMIRQRLQESACFGEWGNILRDLILSSNSILIHTNFAEGFPKNEDSTNSRGRSLIMAR